MLGDDVVAATKRTVDNTFDSWGSSGGKRKRKRSQRKRDAEQEQSDGVFVHTLKHQGSDNSGHRPEFEH